MNKWITLVVLLSMLGCQEDITPDNPPTGFLQNNVLVSNGNERAYHLFVPEDYNNKPMVILLHGNRGSHDDIIGLNNTKAPHKIWLSLADQKDFIVLVPNGTIGDNGTRGWNDCRSDAQGNSNAADLTFLSGLLDDIKNLYNYDANRVYVVGTSNGGHMAIRLAQEIPDRIAAFAAIVASMPENSDCTNSSTPISALFMNGTEDPFLPYVGGEMAANRGEVFSTEQSINYWTSRNGTSTMPIIFNLPENNTSDGSSAIKYLYQNGSNNTEVALYQIVNGGHTEPSIQERYSNVILFLLGNQNGDFEMAEEIWNFFKDKSK